MVPKDRGITGIRSWAATFKSLKLAYSRKVRGRKENDRKQMKFHTDLTTFFISTPSTFSVDCLNCWYYWELRYLG